MGLQKCVEKLFAVNTEYRHPEQAINQALSLEALSSDLYTDPFRFLYELIQNADDAGSTRVQIALINRNYLVVAHQGRVFEGRDVRGLCAVGGGTKKNQLQSTGYKGLGFKAVFGKSDNVTIMSNGEFFRFDAEHPFEWKWTEIKQPAWERENERKFVYPWHICPIWTERKDLPEPVRSWVSTNDARMKVATIIRLKDTSDAMIKALKEVTEQSHMFLFLRNICDVDVSLDVQTTFSIRKVPQPDRSIQLFRNNEPCSRWLVSVRQVPVSPEMRHDSRIPEKLRRLNSTEMGLAAKIDASNVQRIVSVQDRESILFSFVPTKISTYNFPLLVNANFLTSANREQIHIDSVWNQGLFSSIPNAMVGWLIELNHDPLWFQTAYALVPNKAIAQDTLAMKYNEKCRPAMLKNKFIRSMRGDHLTPGEAIIDLTELSQQPFIGNDAMLQFVLHTYEPPPTQLGPYSFVAKSDRLLNLKILKFDWDNAITMLSSPDFQRNFSADYCLNFIDYLFEHREDEEISKRLRRLPFILDQNHRLRTPAEIYFLSAYNDAQWHHNDSVEGYVHETLMPRLTPVHVQWLSTLGVTPKTDLSFLHRTIIPRAAHFITPDNAVFTIQRLFFLFQQGQVVIDDLTKLNKLCLFTLNHQLVAADELYLSQPYLPSLPLEAVLPRIPQLFLCPSYINDKNLTLQWKYFFLTLGVRENIDFTLLPANHPLCGAYRDAQRLLIYGLGSYSISGYKNNMNLRFLELTVDNFDFARFFWQHLIRTFDPRLLLEPEVAFWGQEGRSGMTQGSCINNFPQWFVRTQRCIPVVLHPSIDGGKCLRALDVFTNQLRPIIGHFLPAVEFDSPLTHEWQQFFRFRTELSLENYLFILQQMGQQQQPKPTNDGEQNLRIQLIYTNLLANVNDEQAQSYLDRCRSMDLQLLSDRSVFQPAGELYVWSIESHPSPPSLSMLTLSTGNRHHPNLSHLLQLLDVRQIQSTELTSLTVNPRPCDELRHRLQHTPVLLWLQSQQTTGVDLERLGTMDFIEVDRIELYVSNGTILVGHSKTRIEHNRLFIEGPWQHNPELPKTLCELLQLPLPLFKTHIHHLISARSVEDFLYHSVPLAAMNHDHLAAIIGMDNEELFGSMGLPLPSTSPAELLIAGLEAQDSCWTGYVYHFTHLENAVMILRDRALKSRSQIMSPEAKDSAALDVIEHTDMEVFSYARLYFRPHTPTQFCNENLGNELNSERYGNIPVCPVPVFFRIDLRQLLSIPDLPWGVSLGSMASRHTEYGSSMHIIRRFDFRGVYEDSRMERGKSSSQHEFLIENQLDLSLLPDEAITLIYQDANAQRSLELLCNNNDESAINYAEVVDDAYFFGKNPRIDIAEDDQSQYVTVSMRHDQLLRPADMLVVQVEPSDAHGVACNGNLSAVFHCDHVTSVYGRASLTVFIGGNSYCVYCIVEGQPWLIHTNHSNAHFDSCHKALYPALCP